MDMKATQFLGQVLAPGRRALAISAHEPHVVTHLAERRFEDDGTPEQTSAYFAVARYEWILKAGRKRLAGKFTPTELEKLFEVFEGHVFDPKLIETLGEYVAEYFRRGCQDVDGTPMRTLVTKVKALDQFERCALADAIERRWHTTLQHEGDIMGMAEDLGIVLKGAK